MYIVFKFKIWNRNYTKKLTIFSHFVKYKIYILPKKELSIKIWKSCQKKELVPSIF